MNVFVPGYIRVSAGTGGVAAPAAGACAGVGGIESNAMSCCALRKLGGIIEHAPMNTGTRAIARGFIKGFIFLLISWAAAPRDARGVVRGVLPVSWVWFPCPRSRRVE